MRFVDWENAVAWLDAHTGCQKAIWVDLGSGVFVGDAQDLPGVKEDWLEVTYARLVKLAESVKQLKASFGPPEAIDEIIAFMHGD